MKEKPSETLTRKIIGAAEAIRVSSAQVQRLQLELDEATRHRDQCVYEHRQHTLELAAIASTTVLPGEEQSK